MQWILENWVSILFFGGFIGVHFFMHGRGGHGHGHGGGHGGHKGGHQHGEGGKTQSDINVNKVIGISGEESATNANQTENSSINRR